MFAVYRKDGRMMLLCKRGDEFACYHQCFLVGKGNGLLRLNGSNGWPQSGEPDHSSQHNVDVRHLHHIAKGICTAEDLEGKVGKGFTDGREMLLIGNHHHLGLEFASLCDEFLHTVVRRQDVSLVLVGVFAYDVKRLGTDGTGRAQYRDFLHFFVLKWMIPVLFQKKLCRK